MARKHDKHHDDAPEDAPEDAAARRDAPARSDKVNIHQADPAAQHAHDAGVAGETVKSPEQQEVADQTEQPAQDQPAEETAPAEPTQSAAVSIPYGESRVLRIQGDGELRTLIEYTIDNPAVAGANIAGTDYLALRIRGIMPGATTLRVAVENAEGTILKAVAEITVEECRGPASSIDLVEMQGI